MLSVLAEDFWHVLVNSGERTFGPYEVDMPCLFEAEYIAKALDQDCDVEYEVTNAPYGKLQVRVQVFVPQTELGVSAIGSWRRWIRNCWRKLASFVRR